MLGFGECPVHIAALLRRGVADIAVELFARQRCSGFKRLCGIDDRRQRGILHRNGVGGILRERVAVGHHGGNRRAHCVHGATGQQGMRRDLHARHQWHHWHMQALAQVVAGHDGDHAGQRLRCAHMYGEYVGVRVGAAQKRHVQHARKLHVIHITALAGDQRWVFDAPY